MMTFKEEPVINFLKALTSGYRTPSRNKALGRGPKSPHIQDRAMDIYAEGISPERIESIMKLLALLLEYLRRLTPGPLDGEKQEALFSVEPPQQTHG